MAVFTCHVLAAAPEVVDMSYGLWRSEKNFPKNTTKFISVPIKLCDIKGKAPTNYDSFVPLSTPADGEGEYRKDRTAP